MTKLRKDNYARATTEFGEIFGKVLSVSKDTVVLATDGGAPALVRREDTNRITVAEFKDGAGTTAQTFDRAGGTETFETFPGPKPEGVVRPEVKATDLFATEVEDLTEEAVELPELSKEIEETAEKAPKVDKKAVCAAIFKDIFDGSKESAKEVKRLFREAGCTPHGANTYFYNFKHGKWTV